MRDGWTAEVGENARKAQRRKSRGKIDFGTRLISERHEKLEPSLLHRTLYTIWSFYLLLPLKFANSVYSIACSRPAFHHAILNPWSCGFFITVCEAPQTMSRLDHLSSARSQSKR